MAKPKWFQGSLKAMVRLGLAEARNIFYPQSNVAAPTDPGIWGSTTPGEGADQRQGNVPPRTADAKRPPSVLDARMAAAKEQSMDVREPSADRDREMG